MRHNHLIIMLICGGDGYLINNHSQRSAVHLIFQPLVLALSKRFSMLFGVLGRTDPKGSFLTYMQRLAKALADTETDPIKIDFEGETYYVTLAFALLVGDSRGRGKEHRRRGRPEHRPERRGRGFAHRLGLVCRGASMRLWSTPLPQLRR